MRRIKCLFSWKTKFCIFENLGRSRIYLAESDPFFRPEIARPESDLIWVNIHTRAVYQWYWETQTWILVRMKERIVTQTGNQVESEGMRIAIARIDPFTERELKELIHRKWMKNLGKISND